METTHTMTLQTREQSGQMSDALYQWLFENLDDGFAYHQIIVDDLGRPVDYIFLDANEAFETCTGLHKDQILGKRVTAIIPGITQAKPDLIKIYGKVALTGEKQTFELYFDPFQQWYAVSILSPAKGYFATIFRNITEKKQIEQERERLNAQLAEKNNELQQIVYVTSHDLRAPLVNVEGFTKELRYALTEMETLLQGDGVSEALRDELNTLLKEEIYGDMEYILNAVAKMGALLEGLLKISRLSRAAITIGRLDMNALLAGILQAFEFQLAECNVRVELSDLPSCYGDVDQMHLVFSNLLSNALKYLDPHRLGIIKIWAKNKGDDVMYCVEDNGIGIAAEQQEKVFEIFHRLNPGESQGEGLGLTIIQKILERHAGKIGLESEPGVGSTFYVSLPKESR